MKIREGDIDALVSFETKFPKSLAFEGDNPVIVYGADDKFSMGLAVSLFSALLNLKSVQYADVFVIDGGISEHNKRRIIQVAEKTGKCHLLKFIHPDPVTLNNNFIKEKGRFQKSVYLRILIPELLPNTIKKVIYLDSDCIIEKDLAELWRKDINNKALLAVQERFVSSKYGLFNWQELGINPRSPYFNSGVLVFNLDFWRKSNTSQQVLNYIYDNAKHFKVPGDQEGLNAVLSEKWTSIDVRWNLINPFYDNGRFARYDLREQYKSIRSKLLRDPFIIHYNAPDKPWHGNCTHPARRRFIFYLRESEWFNSYDYFFWCLRIIPAQVTAGFRKKASRLFRFIIDRPVRLRTNPAPGV